MIMGGSNGDSSSGACSALVKTDASFCAILCKRSEGVGRVLALHAHLQWSSGHARLQEARPCVLRELQVLLLRIACPTTSETG